MEIAYILVPFFAFILDLMLGDPKSKYHPVALIGSLILYFEKIFYYKNDSKLAKYFYGFCVVLSVLVIVALIALLLKYIGALLGPIATIIINIIVLYITIAARSLDKAASAIYILLRRKNIPKAQAKLSMIVGRDTNNLTDKEIIRATVETVAEGIVDGIVSPLLFYSCFGIVGALLYRTINTMDSMLGHKNDRYKYFGTIAARLDDVCNFIPARITLYLIAFAALIMKKDWRNTLKIAKRDAKKHPSPNSGYSEAAVAGALHIQLGGLNYYNGTPNDRALLGDSDVELKALHIRNSIGLMYITSLTAVILTIIIHTALYPTIQGAL